MKASEFSPIFAATKLVCLLLALAMTLSFFAACNSAQNESDGSSASESESGSTEIESKSESTESELKSGSAESESKSEPTESESKSESVESESKSETTESESKSEPAEDESESVLTESETEPITQGEETAADSNELMDYGDVVELFRAIVDYYPRYTKAALREGRYYGIDDIASENTRDIYKRLFVSGYALYFDTYAMQYMEDGRNSFGYAIHDLNGNGSDELILLSELYEIVAIFTVKDGRPELLFDSFDTEYEYTIDKEGRIYQSHYVNEDNNYAIDLHTTVYALNGADAPEIAAQYVGIDANVENSDECYDITGGQKTRISRSEWESLTYGRLLGYERGIINKTHTDFEFVRLFGDLYLYSPYTWEWESEQFETHKNVLCVSLTDEGLVSIGLIDMTPFENKANVSATLDGNVARFESPQMSGSLEFGLDCVWLVIDSSNISALPVGAYLYTEVATVK